MDHAIVTILQATEDLEIFDVQTSEVLEGLEDRDISGILRKE
jgi:hypothetical protein